MTQQFEYVWAQDSRRVIGINHTIPWHLPEDLTHFKKLTHQHVIVMGTRTYQSLPTRTYGSVVSPSLPHRCTIVVGNTYAHQPAQLIEHHSTRHYTSTHIDSSHYTEIISQLHATHPSPAATYPVSLTICVPTLADLNALIETHVGAQHRVFIIGGEQIFRALMPRARTAHITDIALDAQQKYPQPITHIAHAPQLGAQWHYQWEPWNTSAQGIKFRHGTATYDTSTHT